MKEKLALVIAALMVTSIAFSISTTSVSASHTPTVIWKETGTDTISVKGNTTMVLTITVQNAGPDPIDNVRVTFPDEWSPATCVTIPEDNLVNIEGPDENLVLLKAGTIVLLDNATLDNIRIPENTEVIGLVNSYFYREESVTDNQENFFLYTENATMEFRQDNTVDIVKNENIAVVGDVSVVLDNGLVRLAQDTLAVRAGGANVWFPEDTTVEVVLERDGTTQENENVTLQRTVTIKPKGSENIKLRLIGSAKIKFVDPPYTGWAVEISDENVTLHPDNQLAVAENTKVILLSGTSVTIAENTQVIRPVENEATVENIDYLENTPKDWDQETAATYVQWAGIKDNQIKSAGSLDFPFAVTTPNENKTSTLFVKTVDNKGVPKVREIKVVVDNILPTVTITASPEWVKDNVEVTITVTASETLARLDNVLVAENQAPENSAATFVSVSDDNKVWTWTYTTGDNEDRDGVANIYVLAADFEDLVGNEGSAATETFTVDRQAPPMPDLRQISGYPTDELDAVTGIQTNDSEYLLENNALDNYLRSFTTQEDMTVKIRVGTNVVPVTTGTNGYWYYELTLIEGTQELGIQVVDRAGNEGTENAENITYDATAPSITPGTIAGKTLADNVWINDNTPKITITIADAVLGVENLLFADNGGYSVQFWDENKDPIGDNLVNALAHDNFTLNFENTFDNAQPGGMYYIFVTAGDNLQMDNKYIMFRIDVDAPSAAAVVTSFGATGHGILDPVTMAQLDPITNHADVLFKASTEPNATVKIWSDDTLIASGTADSNGDFSIAKTLTEGTYVLYVQVIDQAGNESTKELLGTRIVDLTKPSIALTAPEDGTTTDKSAITVSGTITDTICDYDEFKLLQIDATGAVVGKTIYLNPDGSFSATVPLVEGNNVINVIASDEAGNQQIVSVTVSRTVTPWATYAVIIVIVALILAAIAIFRKR